MIQDQFQALREHLNLLSQTLEAGKAAPNSDQNKLRQMQDWIFCMELGMVLYTEANRAVQAGAWFAATAVSASALEAVLLGKCFLEQDKIKALPKWSTLKRSQKADFGLFVRSMDLGKLLEIADQLSWFPSKGVPESFLRVMRPLVDELTMKGIDDLFENTLNVGQVCANHLREYRNLIHPAVCLREGRQPSVNAGMTATFMFLIAFSSISEAT